MGRTSRPSQINNGQQRDDEQIHGESCSPWRLPSPNSPSFDISRIPQNSQVRMPRILSDQVTRMLLP